jgi:tight adherence protein B
VEPDRLIFVALAALAAGGVAWALFYPMLSGQAKVEKRQKAVGFGQRVAAPATATAAASLRRGDVADSLKELDDRQKRLRTPPLSVRLEQAGLASWSKTKFYIVSVITGIVLGLVALVFSGSLIGAALAGFTGLFGLPRWTLKFLRARRQKAFLLELPNAVDVILRGVKAGLPLADCMRIIASEAQEPLRSEFRYIIEQQAVGIPLGDATAKLYERTGLTEANFFAIVVAIQQKAGGSLSDALGNLSRVLRDRRKMRAKIQAMSMEAKASAAIIGSLPIIVMMLVYMTSPNYIQLLWTTTVGTALLVASATWMTIGVLVMRKMINLDI